ncbi:MAG TPA: DUF805 domain-containing protein [Cellvibrionaceae bacterium]|nr:DUF805 domain-containing protein [Cellvibrionaceae bacterium]HMW70259.1 DUF805 domain-containing protein [Cellvibrionaceae bacterium]HNG59267.1 DUF805 domain-containing protein [Cellvibrionaceae bacterium]
MTNNVYAAPVGNVVEEEQAFGEVNFFSPGSRVNRLRYWAHITLALYAFCVCIGLAGASAVISPELGIAIGGIAYIGFFVFSVIVGIQRLHDLNKSGWLWLLNFIPLVNLYVVILVIFFPGTPGENRFGLPTPPSKTWHWVVALSFPVLAIVLGIVAAVAIPQYQQFVNKAKAAQVMPVQDGN